MEDQVITQACINGVLQEISPNEFLDAPVIKIMSKITEDKIKRLVEYSCEMAAHRGSNEIADIDIKCAAEKFMKMADIIPSLEAPLVSTEPSSTFTAKYQQVFKPHKHTKDK
jgi:hypothetical protein